MEEQLHEFETTRGEKILAVVLVIFLLIGGIWVLQKFEDIPAYSSGPYWDESAWRIYRLQVFALQLGLTIPLFIIALVLFFKVRARKSPYLIHMNAFMAFSAILFAYVLVEHNWIWWLWGGIGLFGLSMVGAALSAYALAYLKKYFFSFERVSRSRLRKNRCPWCGFPLPIVGASEFCRNCGKRVMKICEECNTLRFVYLLYCHHCGSIISS